MNVQSVKVLYVVAVCALGAFGAHKWPDVDTAARSAQSRGEIQLWRSSAKDASHLVVNSCELHQCIVYCIRIFRPLSTFPSLFAAS